MLREFYAETPKGYVSYLSSYPCCPIKTDEISKENIKFSLKVHSLTNPLKNTNLVRHVYRKVGLTSSFHLESDIKLPGMTPCISFKRTFKTEPVIQ